jgi:trk system potassium uptake protein TrkA
MSNSQFAVIGLGSFGYAVARTLLEKGCQVLCIDRLEERLEQVREIATLAVQADATDEKAPTRRSFGKWASERWIAR